jgi:hypothetical protein
MKKLNSIFLLLALLVSTAAFSQDATNAVTEEKPTFTISGSVDTYAHTSLGLRNAAFGEYAPTTSFANLRGFSLGMANIIASYAGEKVGFTADLVFGPRGRAAVFYDGSDFGSVTGQRIINQMFAYYKLSDAVTINLGQFNTFVGYEVISPAINANYSTSYLFSNGPFNHTGLRADFAFGEGMVAKLAIMNPTDMVEWNPKNTYTLGAQIGKTSDAGGIWLNVLYGDQDGKLKEDVDTDADTFSAGSLFQVDVTGGWTDGSIEKAGNDASSFMGVALYPKFTLSDAFALGVRAEYFAITKSHPLASPIPTDDGDGNIMALTLTGNWKIDALTIMPELRFDKPSEEGLFFDEEGEDKDSMISLTLAAVYKF